MYMYIIINKAIAGISCYLLDYFLYYYILYVYNHGTCSQYTIDILS